MSEEARLYWLLGAVATALLGAIWLTGALSAAIFGSGWTPIPLSALAATALRLPSHLADPSGAWPRGSRAALPGPLGFYSVALLVLALAAAIAFLGARASELIDLAAIAGKGRQRAPSARWASRRELRVLRVPAAQRGRLTLGRSGRALLAAQERQSVIVFGPTSTLKTTGLAIPALLEWQGPVLATSVKNDLLADTLARRAELGKVMIFDPSQVTKLPRSRATPLLGATNWRGAMRVAHWLCAGAQTARPGMKDADFWFAAAEKLLAPLLFAAAANGEKVEAVVRWLDEGPEASEAEVAELLARTEVAEAERAWLATQNREARQRSSVYTTAELVMATFADPKVIEETAASDYTPGSLLDGRANTLYLCAPLHEQERLRTLFSMIVQELLAVVYESAAASGEPIDPPLLLLLDEAANIAPIPNLDEIASTGAGQGIQLLSVFQDFAQLSARYGRRSATIVNNHRAKIFGTGISDPEALSYVSRIVGVGEFEQRSRTAGERGRRSTTEGDTYRDLVPGNVLRQADPGTGLLVYGHLPPAKIRLRPWFRERKLKKLREASPGGSAVKEEKA